MSELNKNTTVTNPDNKSGHQPSDAGNQSATALTQDDIVKLIEARERAKQEDKNLALAMDRLKQIFGEKSDEALTKISQKLGLPVEELNRIAKSSPEAFLNLVGAKPQDTTTRSMASQSRNTAAAGDTTETGERNKAYYDKLKSEMGIRNFVLDAGLQKQLHRDMMRLGDAWDG